MDRQRTCPNRLVGTQEGTTPPTHFLLGPLFLWSLTGATPFEATVSVTSGPAFDPVAELDRFRHDAASSESQSIDLAEHSKQIARERAAGRRVLRVDQAG